MYKKGTTVCCKTTNYGFLYKNTNPITRLLRKVYCKDRSRSVTVLQINNEIMENSVVDLVYPMFL